MPPPIQIRPNPDRFIRTRYGVAVSMQGQFDSLNPNMTILVCFSLGRILQHCLAILGDDNALFHLKGIARELP